MEHMNSFSLAALPQLEVGAGSLKTLIGWLKAQDHTSILLCIGGSSFKRSGHLSSIEEQCRAHGIKFVIEQILDEPSPEIVTAITQAHIEKDPTCVVGIGGGSVIDAAKAVSAMIAEGRLGNSSSITDYLEGVGTLTPSGKRLGLVAVPTTSGTGTEATKNAVISSVGANGFKKSLRHIQYVPDLAILDGELITTCPRAVSAASGLDAVTQLLEAYVSTASNPFTERLALQGLTISGSVLPGIINGSLSDNSDARTQMAYAAYLSGVALANANLGVVHGAASVLGGARAIPHGVVCGTLLRSATETIIAALKVEGRAQSLNAYAQAGYALMGVQPEGIDKGLDILSDILNRWESEFSLPRLSQYGFTKEELETLAPAVGIKNTPAALSAEEVSKMLLERL